MPIDQERIEVSWRDETLAGTLHIPANAAGQLVLQMQGSGPSDRDADGYFTAIRQAFLDRDIATFAFDKPGCGSSTGDWRRHALFDRADQADVVLSHLATHAAVDGDRMGVWGQSQGGWLAQIVAANRDDLAFAIANSGPSIGVEAQNLYSCEHTMRSQGSSEADIAQALTLVEKLQCSALEGDPYADVLANLLAPARGSTWGSYVDVEDELDWNLTAAFIREAYSPIPTLEQVRCPFLAIYGGLDTLVPAWSSARETGAALRGCVEATVVVFPNADHRIQVAGPLDFAPGYLDLLGDWAAARFRRAG